MTTEKPSGGEILCFFCKGHASDFDFKGRCEACDIAGYVPFNSVEGHLHKALYTIRRVFFPEVPEIVFNVSRGEKVAILVVQPNHLFIVEEYDKDYVVWMPGREKNHDLFTGAIIEEFDDPDQLRAYLRGRGLQFKPPVA